MAVDGHVGPVRKERDAGRFLAMLSQLDLLAIGAVLATLVFWASAFAGIRAGLQGYAPEQLVLLRQLVGSAAFLVFALATRLGLPERRDLPGIVAVGACGFAGYQLALSHGERTVPAGPASLLVNAVPIITALIAVAFLGERMRPLGWLGLAIGFAGAAIVATSQGEAIRLTSGAMLVLLAALLQSLHFTIQKPYMVRYQPLAFTAYCIWAGTLLLLPLLPGLLPAVQAAPLPATAAVVYLGIFPTAIANVTWAYVLSRFPASRAASFLYLAPGIAFLIGWLWLAEIPSVQHLVGGAIALAGVILLNTRGRVVTRTTPEAAAEG